MNVRDPRARGALRRRSVLQGLLAAAAVHVAPVAATTRYPSRPVRVVVPWPPGASVDVSARLIANRMGTALGESFIVDNKGGASGLLGADIVAKAAPDGYTLMFHTSSHAVNPIVFPKLPYDTMNDFASIGRAYTNVLGVVVNAGLPVSSLAEFIKYAKARKEPLNFASSGLGTPHQLAGEMLKMQAGFDMQHIAYKGGAPAVLAVASGQVGMAVCSLASVMGAIQAGQVRLIAVTQKTRYPGFPDIPAVAEMFPGFDISGWGAMFAPAGTPPEIIATLHRELVRAAASDNVTKTLTTSGLTPATSSPEELTILMEEDLKKWTAVLKSGIKIS